MVATLYISASGGSDLIKAQAIRSNNLANANTPGFKAMIQDLSSVNIFMEQTLPTSTYSLNNAPVVDLSPGPLQKTGNELDVAINGDGFLVVQNIDANGVESERLTRRGDLSIDQDGDLANGAGHKILSDGGAVIPVPQYNSLHINSSGEIYYTSNGSDNQLLLAKLNLVAPDKKNLVFDENGLLYDPNNPQQVFSDEVKVVSGFIEGSNVNPVSEMIDMLALTKTYEINLKMIQKAEENDSKSDKTLQLA